MKKALFIYNPNAGKGLLKPQSLSKETAVITLIYLKDTRRYLLHQLFRLP